MTDIGLGFDRHDTTVNNQPRSTAVNPSKIHHITIEVLTKYRRDKKPTNQHSEFKSSLNSYF